MIYLLIGILFFIFVFYYIIQYIINQDVTYIDLSEGDRIDNEKNVDTKNKQFSYSFWLYMVKPPSIESTIFSHEKDNTKIILSSQNSTLKLALDDSMYIYLDNYPFQKWNYINIVYFAGTVEVYVNALLEKTLETPVQNIHTNSLVQTPITIGNYDNSQQGWQKNSAYIAHFNYDPNSSYDQEKIMSLYKYQIQSLVKNDTMSVNVNLLKNGTPIN